MDEQVKQQKTSGNGGPDEEREVRLRVLRDLAGCLGSLYLWKYDADLKLLESSNPDPQYWNDVFLFTDCGTRAKEHCGHSNRPVLVSSQYGLQWIACPYRETEGSCSIYVLGPLFLSEYSQHKMERSLEYRDVSVELKLQLLEQLKKIPSIAMEMVVYLGVMLQFCLTGEKISPQEIVFRKLQTADAGAEEDEAEDLLPGPHGGGAAVGLSLLRRRGRGVSPHGGAGAAGGGVSAGRRRGPAAAGVSGDAAGRH